MGEKKSIPNYLQIFDKKLDALKERIKREIEKPKKERNKESLKHFLADAKSLRKVLKQAKHENAVKCPHCDKCIF
jgi:molecular chaperone GrpE (heat shock protein)